MKLIVCLLALAATAASAQGRTDYALNDGQVHFRVPPTWTAIMEKAEGNPQAVAFQVPDPSAQGSGDAADVTVKTRQLKAPTDFADFVQDEFDRAKAHEGYENDTTNKDTSVHRYFVLRGKTKYLVRDSFELSGGVAVQVRCRRPLLATTPAEWNTEFDRACAGVAASLKQ